MGLPLEKVRVNVLFAGGSFGRLDEPGFRSLNPHGRVPVIEDGDVVVVTINDRGPTGPGRIIDLSDSAFAHIASLGEGVIKVRIRW